MFSPEYFLCTGGPVLSIVSTACVTTLARIALPPSLFALSRLQWTGVYTGMSMAYAIWSVFRERDLLKRVRELEIRDGSLPYMVPLKDSIALQAPWWLGHGLLAAWPVVAYDAYEAWKKLNGGGGGEAV